MRNSPLLLLAFSLVFPALGQAQATGPQAGQKVAFLGDSITAFGWQHPAGYVQLVAKAMEQQGRKIDVIPAGISGQTSKDMLARIQGVINAKPDWMTLSCGVNDVWHGAAGCTLDEYKTNITAIVDQTTAAGIKVVILTATMINEDQSNANNQKLIAYNDFLRSLAKEKNLPLADLNADEQAALAQIRTQFPKLGGNLLTDDGVHMNGFGDQMMAAGILKAFGFTDAQLAQAKTAWSDLPGAMRLNVHAETSTNEYSHLRDLADSQGKTVDALLNELVKKDIQTLIDTPVSTTAPAPAESPAPATPKP